MRYIYVYLDPRKQGSYSYEKYFFEYEPFYVGKGTKDRMFSHLKFAKSKKESNDHKINKIRSILNDGFEPVVFKIVDNISTVDEINQYEKEAIKLIGKLCENKGPLLNIADGGDGGKVWHGDHVGKGKKLEDYMSLETALWMRNMLSNEAKKRVGEKNPLFGKKKTKPNSTKGSKRSEEERKNISDGNKKYLESLSDEEYNELYAKATKAKEKISDEIKQQWYQKISRTMKEKTKDGLSEKHIENLKKNHFKKLNKGDVSLKLTDETKKKLSLILKGRKFSEEHLKKLKKTITFDEFEIELKKLIASNIVNNIAEYKEYAKQNKHLKFPISPERTYKNWKGWKFYFN